jgi:hypothetical protein
MASTSDSGPQALRKAKCAAWEEANKAINTELAGIEEQLHELMEAAAEKLNIDIDDIRS